MHKTLRAWTFIGGLCLACSLPIACLPGSPGDKAGTQSPDQPRKVQPAAPDDVGSTASAESQIRAQTARLIGDGSDRTLNEHVQDASITARIKTALADERSLRIFDFEPDVVRAKVVIRGDVNTLDQHERAERVTRSVEGVAEVINRITVGGRTADEVAVSGEKPVEGSDTRVYHTVEAGDSLWSIAKEYRASVQQLKRLNDLGRGNLKPGQRIRVR